ncbi:radical SAM protein [Pseudomonas sp. CGJS7]|uniref:radical SAM protein n=1 Tax=Pseudomonas sp. CGJS7 TaxID=3109348 RepID=UPI00300A49B4
MRINTLYVIIKIVERCNLNCSYCYYYAPENADVYLRPAKMSVELLDRLIDYIAEAFDSTEIGGVVFAFHGGEPTLAKADAIREFCDTARRKLVDRAKSVAFAIQTNGVFISDAWLKLIHDHEIHVGVSLDGDRESHDQYRVDHRGRGSYDRIRVNIEKLKTVATQSRVNLAALTVMEPAFKGLDYYRHMVDEIGLRDLKPLFPDCTFDNPPPAEDATRLGRSLCDIFDHWLLHDRNRVRVLLFEDAVRNVMLAPLERTPHTDEVTLGCAVLSDGRVLISDDFMPPAEWFAGQQRHTVFDSSFADWFSQPHVKQALRAKSEVPTGCRACPHANSCRGGEIPHRYSKARGFDNPSAHCTTLKMLYDHIAMRLGSGKAEVERTKALKRVETA